MQKRLQNGMLESMKNQPFRKPSEMLENEPEKAPVSTRISKEAFDALERAAKSQGKKVGWIAANVLEDYAKWISKKP